MAFNRPMSSPFVQNENIFNGQRDHGIIRGVSPGGASVMSSESEISVDNLEDKFVGQPHPKERSWKAFIPRTFTKSRPTRTSSAFQRWKQRQRPPVSKLLLFSIIASIAVMLVAPTPGPHT